MKLYDYFRSSAAFRVRIALNLKRLSYERAFIHLRRNDQRPKKPSAQSPKPKAQCQEPNVHKQMFLHCGNP